MGRPLNKKYFGNRNVGTAVTTDDGIGGNQVASVTLGTLGAYTTRPTATFSDPDKLALGGVRATGTVTSEIGTVAVSGTMADYVTGDLLFLDNAVLTVTAVAGEVTAVAYTDRGSFTALVPGARATTTNNAGTGALISVTYRAKEVVLTNAGSGYTDAADAAVSFTQSVTGTSVLGTSALVGQNENSITMTAFLTGGSATTVDIIRQVSTTRYKVTDGTLTGIVSLTSTLADAAGEGSIAATDSAGGQYFVTKLTGHKATIVQAGGSGWLYTDGEAAPWTLDAPAGIYLQIANA